MRLPDHALTLLWCLVLPASGWAGTPLELAAKKERATTAYQAKQYGVACPLFREVVAAQKFDAWGWNDLALCHLRSGALSEVLEPLDRAAALQKAVGDAELQRAIVTNERLLMRALLLRTSPLTAEARASATLAARHFDYDTATACPLFERALAGTGVSFSPRDWSHIAACQVERGAPAAAVVETLKRAAAHGADIASAAAELSARERVARSGGGDWKSRCVPLDGKACGRAWLLCSEQAPVEGADDGLAETLALIEASSLSKWTSTTPFDVGGEALLQSVDQSTETRCAGHTWPNSVVDVHTNGDVVLAVDPCTETAVRWTFDRECGAGESTLTTQAVAPVAPPAR